MSDAKPFPKSAQLARGERRYRRTVASPKQWQAIIAAKRGPCRVCSRGYGPIEFHHLVARIMSGDDVAENIVPLHAACHERVTRGEAEARAILGEGLTDDERAYIVGELGAGALERLFGVRS